MKDHRIIRQLILAKDLRLKLYVVDYYKVKEFYEKMLEYPILNSWDKGDLDKGVIFDVGVGRIEILKVKGPHVPREGYDLSLEVDNVWALWEHFQSSDFIEFTLRDNDWGDTSFCISDPEGFRITFFTRHSR